MSSSTSRNPDPDQSPSASHVHRSNRVLACVACRQRKIRCSRSFPCTNCQALALDCIPAIPVARQRMRHSIPYKALLEQVQAYENLLRKNDIKFRSLGEQSDIESHSVEDDSDERSSMTSSVRAKDNDLQMNSEAISPVQKIPGLPRLSQRSAMLKYIAQMTQQRAIHDAWNDQASSQGDETEFEYFEYHPWDLSNNNNNNLLFKSFEVINMDISSLHPDPAQMFQLWQIYLDNVNPLLKISHPPTLQARIVNFVKDIREQAPATAREFNALMFGIYCAAVQSLQEDECQAIFGSTKTHLLQIYHFACEQALHACNFLASQNCDCLRALLLYLMSQGSRHDPRSISSMTAAAVRIAERISIDTEFENAKHSLFEAEMRRRLWWCLILFDIRVTGLSSPKPSALSGIWDCKLPLNVNDLDFRPETKKLPNLQTSEFRILPSDTIFLLLRAEVALYKRPALGDSAPLYYRDVQAFETRINNLYLQTCDEDNPLQFAALWMTRGFIAKFWLFNSYQPVASSQNTNLLHHAICMLDCDTKIMTSPLLKGYNWFFEFYFPLPAYIHVAMALKHSPSGNNAEQAWDALANNHYARFPDLAKANAPILDLCNKAILQASRQRETYFIEHGLSITTPRVVLRIHEYYHGLPAVLHALQSDMDFNLLEQGFSQVYQQPEVTYT